MAKRKRETTHEKQERWIKDGRGQGHGSEYKPWLTIQDVPSNGRSIRLKGIKAERIHHLLSDQERDYFYMLEYSSSVIDIREQYPLLPLEQTLLIAEEIGVKHPADPKTNIPIVMTTDFVIDQAVSDQRKVLARTIKCKDDLMKQRTIEKFEIERRYWEKQNIDWGIVTEEEIDKTFARNISIVHPNYCIEDMEPFCQLTKKQREKLIQDFKKEIVGEDIVIREKAFEFDDKRMLSSGSVLAIYKHLIITKQIEIDLFQPINIDIPQSVKLGQVYLEKGVESS